MEPETVQVQRLQQRTACIQVRYNKVEAMGGEFYAVLSPVWKLRFGHEEQCEGNEMQLVLCDEAFARFQSCKAKSEK